MHRRFWSCSMADCQINAPRTFSLVPLFSFRNKASFRVQIAAGADSFTSAKRATTIHPYTQTHELVHSNAAYSSLCFAHNVSHAADSDNNEMDARVSYTTTFDRQFAVFTTIQERKFSNTVRFVHINAINAYTP